ncbi:MULTISPECIES: universal stress protein [Halorussus]|uniref:universal stress protein n=1 Tax=Halorussus TaxID=1070314 RepID=UPI000E213DFD|nr:MULTISPECIES: universal stress protein [Halorussus]NHN57500.1 universal stress protein [Halorussus sp. JP-T4]
MALETILLAVGPGDADRTEELARTVVEVAEPTDARVVLAHVFTDEEFDGVVSNLDYDPAGEIDPDEVAERHATVRRLTDAFDDAGVEYAVRGRVGEHGETIVDLAKEVEADRVVVGGRKRSPAGKAVFGSTAQEVMLNAPCPVTFVRGE